MVSRQISLEEGRYTFTINDSWGDGLCCSHGEGFYRVHCGGGYYVNEKKFHGRIASHTFSTHQSVYQLCDVGVLRSSVELTNAVNDHRASKGKPRLPVSISLIAVAQDHVINQEYGDWSGFSSNQCNLHTWLDDVEDDRFDGCCYTADHSNANCMWRKPSQITAGWNPSSNGCQAMRNQFKHYGYEISHGASGFQVTAQSAVNGWQGSPPHRAVMLSEGNWEQFTKTIGCAMGENYAHCWFAMEDPNEKVPF